MISFTVRVLFLVSVAWATCAAGGTLRIGSVSNEVSRELKVYQPFAEFLAAELKADGIEKGTAMVAGDMHQMAEWLRTDQIDLYVDSPFPMLVINDLAGSRPLVRRWKKGVAEYHGVIFTRKDSGINSVRGLRGKVIAFEEPFSTSSYFLPKAGLTQAGEQLVPLSSAREKPRPNEIGYVFSDDDENTMVWVLRGKTAAGAMSNVSFNKLSAKRKDELRILHNTITVPRHAVSYRARLDPALLEKIREILLNMHANDRSKEVLRDFGKTTKFDEFPDGASNTFAPIRDLVRQISTEME